MQRRRILLTVILCSPCRLAGGTSSCHLAKQRTNPAPITCPAHAALPVAQPATTHNQLAQTNPLCCATRAFSTHRERSAVSTVRSTSLLNRYIQPLYPVFPHLRAACAILGGPWWQPPCIFRYCVPYRFATAARLKSCIIAARLVNSARYRSTSKRQCQRAHCQVHVCAGRA